MHQKAWGAGYADGLAGRPYGSDPLHQVDGLAYASGYIEGHAAARKGWIIKPLPALQLTLGKAFITTKASGIGRLS